MLLRHLYGRHIALPGKQFRGESCRHCPETQGAAINNAMRRILRQCKQEIQGRTGFKCQRINIPGLKCCCFQILALIFKDEFWRGQRAFRRRGQTQCQRSRVHLCEQQASRKLTQSFFQEIPRKRERVPCFQLLCLCGGTPGSSRGDRHSAT